MPRLRRRGEDVARARLTIGTFGDIAYLEAPRGRVVARTRYRYWDGKSRLVQATANTRSQAEQGACRTER